MVDATVGSISEPICPRLCSCSRRRSKTFVLDDRSAQSEASANVETMVLPDSVSNGPAIECAVLYK